MVARVLVSGMPSNKTAPSSQPAAREAFRLTRQRELEAIKLERGCVDCGYREHPAALQFDHRDGEVRGFASSFASNVLRRWEVVLAEIEKCDVRCANCHAVRHARR